MIRKLLLGTVALAALSTTALAADLPSRRAPPVFVPPIPVFSWTGFYIGGQIGFGFGQDTARLTAPARLTNNGSFARPNGTIGGAHMGYNWSTQSLPILSGVGGGLFGASGLVVGIEGDIDGSDYRDVGALGPFATAFRSQIQGSARGRLGFAVDRALFYATGGAAFAQFQSTYVGGGGFLAPNASRVGYTVGGGVEYAVTTQWSLRAEYRYSDFGTIQSPTPGGAAARREIMQRAQVGFSYKFDTPVVPVVARY